MKYDTNYTIILNDPQCMIFHVHNRHLGSAYGGLTHRRVFEQLSALKDSSIVISEAVRREKMQSCAGVDTMFARLRISNETGMGDFLDRCFYLNTVQI